MVEKGFLLGIAVVGGLASVLGTLPAFLIALFGTPEGILVTAYTTSASEQSGLGNTATQNALSSFAQELGTAEGTALAQGLNSGGGGQPATTATGQTQTV